jgi:antitoxin PrlF
MSPSSTISSKGQVTVPIEVRHRLGLKAGDRVEFVYEEGRTVLRPAQAPENPFTAYLGALPAFSSLEEINAWVRDLRDDDPWEKPAHEEGKQ